MFLILVDKGVYEAGTGAKISEGFFSFFLIVTFLKRIESKGKTEGERGVLGEKISRDFCSEGSANDGEET